VKATRQTQPFRRSMSRAPSQVLDTMRAGRSAGAALMTARRAQRGAGAGRFPGGLRGVQVPRSSPRVRNMRA
jgi:hypothetical protein